VAADVVRAGLAAMLSHAGAVAEGGALALELLRSPDVRVRLQALPPAATWLIHAGRADAAVREAEGVLAGVGAPLRREDVLRARGWTTTATVIALVTAGRLAEAEDALASALGDPMRRPALDAGTLALLRGRLALAQGRPATARRALGEAALAHDRSDPLGRAPWVLALLAEAHALLGDTAAARAALEGRPAAFDNNRLAADARRAVVWVMAIEGDVAGAADRALALADEAAAEGYTGFELVHLVEAVRLGALGVAGRLVEVAGRVEGPLARAHAEMAPALVTGDGAGLDAAADRFAALGTMLPAAEAATRAARAHRRAGALRHARASADRAQELREHCEGAWTPALAGGSALDDLTPREREVVLLAGRGLSSRAVADRFGVSVRTIDNQLGRAYRKLGITSRAELSSLLDAALPPAKGA
jgi:DNA-binding CsgD family transcriptional regulator